MAPIGYSAGLPKGQVHWFLVGKTRLTIVSELQIVAMTSENRDQESPRHAFGRRLRQLRRDQNWTLAEVAERSGLAISTISKAERGIIALTYDRLEQLAKGVGVDLAAFFSPDDADPESGVFTIARKGESNRRHKGEHVSDILFHEVRNKTMRPVLSTLKPGSSHAFNEIGRRSGQEFLIVLEGDITVFVEDREPVRLGEGDSLYFDSTVGHMSASAGNGEARVLMVRAGR